MENWHANTVAVAAGRPSHAEGNPVNAPIAMSSTFHHFSERDYAREGSDTVAAFEAALGALDGGTALAFSSGVCAKLLENWGLKWACTVMYSWVVCSESSESMHDSAPFSLCRYGSNFSGGGGVAGRGSRGDAHHAVPGSRCPVDRAAEAGQDQPDGGRHDRHGGGCRCPRQQD